MKPPGTAPRASLAHDSAPVLVDALPCSLLGRGLSHQFTGAIGAGWVLVGNQAAISSASVGSLSPLAARRPAGFRDGRDPWHVRNTLDGCRSGGGRRDVSDGPKPEGRAQRRAFPAVAKPAMLRANGEACPNG